MQILSSFRYRVTHVLLYLILIGTIFGLGACGSASQGTSSNSPQVPATATSTAGGNMLIQVKVTTDKLQYTRSETLTVTVSNGLSSNIFITSYQTNCTPLLLEGKKDDGTWVAQNLCYQAQSAAPQQLKAGSVTVYRLTPAFRRPGTAIRSIPWQAGTYRVSISYTLIHDADTVQGGIKVYTQNVTIN